GAATDDEPHPGAAHRGAMVARRAGVSSRRLAPDGECDRDREVRPESSARVSHRRVVRAGNRRRVRAGREATAAWCGGRHRRERQTMRDETLERSFRTRTMWVGTVWF